MAGTLLHVVYDVVQYRAVTMSGSSPVVTGEARRGIATDMLVDMLVTKGDKRERTMLVQADVKQSEHQERTVKEIDSKHRRSDLSSIEE